jgi:hypothetical protein
MVSCTATLEVLLEAITVARRDDNETALRAAPRAVSLSCEELPGGVFRERVSVSDVGGIDTLTFGDAHDYLCPDPGVGPHPSA